MSNTTDLTLWGWETVVKMPVPVTRKCLFKIFLEFWSEFLFTPIWCTQIKNINKLEL